eukprot:7245628-Prymnesium_polylepis.1
MEAPQSWRWCRRRPPAGCRAPRAPPPPDRRPPPDRVFRSARTPARERARRRQGRAAEPVGEWACGPGVQRAADGRWKRSADPAGVCCSWCSREGCHPVEGCHRGAGCHFGAGCRSG